MDGSLGHFKATLQRKKQRAEKKGNRAEHYSSKPGQKVEYNFPKLSKDELEKLKEKIRLDSKRRKKKQIIIFMIIIIFSSISLYFVFN
ncbi:hypothetical protein [Christiangramia sp. OXR-203]|jgi:hypothetical protein|uniref:hypothetical protein n=1 Tax=Christiangramia sp. OXR-203 TaxID=3100176 RepID=UPI002AC8F314|nr:hypothetical protein [Christiangramia sp. OXR-203]WPY97663.1 hypothetical protein T8I65_10800 [Christiangramia sp. OXR-203]